MRLFLISEKKIISIIFIFLITVIVIISFTFFNNKEQRNEKILVGAAASLEPVLTEINRISSQPIDYTFASSGILQQQIEQGAPIDVFISAAPKQMNNLENKGLFLSETRQDLLNNKIALITTKNNPLGLSKFQQLTEKKINLIAIGEPRSVPAGQYGMEVLQNLGILDSLQSKFLFANNVRASLNYVESKNAEAGIVYLTDAKSSDKITVVAIAEDKLHSPIIYPIAVIKNSKNIIKAKQYIEFLQSKNVKDIFIKYGFGVIE